MRDQQPGTLLQWPDPRDEQGQPPPFQITLTPSAGAVAEDLHRVSETVSSLRRAACPTRRAASQIVPLNHRTRQPPGELLDPHEAEISLDGPATIRSGQTLRHGLLVRNLTGQALTIATNGQVTAVVVHPQTGQVAGGFAGAQTMVGISFQVAPGATERLPLLIGTASFRPDLGYTVPPRAWGIQVPLTLDRDLHTREPRLTPVLPLTITA